MSGASSRTPLVASLQRRRPRSSSGALAAAVGVLLAVTAPCPVAAGEAGKADSPPVFSSAGGRVLVDFVARDRDGNLIRDLGAEEVEVFEDGAPQAIDSFQLVARAGAAEEEPVFLALAFDRLTPAARDRARRAAAALLEGISGTGRWVGIFSLDQGLSVVQPFTPDRTTARRVVAELSSTEGASEAGLRERHLVESGYHSLGEGFGQGHVALAEDGGSPECKLPEDVVTRLNKQVESRRMGAFHDLERGREDATTRLALQALVEALGSFPGRKAVVLLSEGLTVSGGRSDGLRPIIAAAHRGRVSLYAADAGGLRVANAADEMRRTLDTIQSQTAGDRDGRLIPEGRLALLERSEQTLRRGPAGGLLPLVEATGGFLIQGTNDLTAGLEEVAEDLASYYLLSYTPQRAEDGSFREISVKVSRPHDRMQARRGYFAVPADLPAPDEPHEAPALAQLERNPPPRDVPLRVRGLQFPEGDGPSHVPVVVEASARSFTFAKDSSEASFHQDFTVLVLVRDGSGHVVKKVSQRYPLRGPLDRLDEARQGDVLFYRDVQLGPGHYTLQAVAYDALSGVAGVASSSLEVDGAAPGRLRASSLVVVRSAEKVGGDDTSATTPLRYGDVLLYPNLGEPVRKEAGRELAFFLTAWPAAGRPGVEARVEVRREGRTIAAAAPLHLQPEADGRIRLVSSLPVEPLDPGAYELRVTLSDGRDAFTRTTGIPIAP